MLLQSSSFLWQKLNSLTRSPVHLFSRGVYTEVCLTVSVTTIVDISKWETVFLWQLYLHPWECFYFSTCSGAVGIEGICVSSGTILSCLAAQPWYQFLAHCCFSVYRCALVFVLLFKVDHRQMHISNGKSNKPRPKQRTGNILITS